MGVSFSEESSQDLFIEFMNEIQNVFYVSSLIMETSKNTLFIAFRRIYNRNLKNSKYDSKKRYALKLIEYNDECDIKCFDREKEIMYILRDFQNIMKYEEIINLTIDNSNYVLASMPFFADSDLFDYIWKSDHIITEDSLRNISFECLKILALLKKHNIVHNDFKFENLLVQNTNPLKLVLTDFESSEALGLNEKSVIFTGTDIYSAPEVLDFEPHDYEADIWSLGANIYTAVFGQFPFGIDIDDSGDKVKEKVGKNHLVNIKSIASKDCWECITAMLILDPNKRITVENAMKLNWFQLIESSNVKKKVVSIEKEMEIPEDDIVDVS